MSVDINDYHNTFKNTLIFFCFFSTLKFNGRFCSQEKFVETRPLIVDLNYSLWPEHDKHSLLLSSL